MTSEVKPGQDSGPPQFASISVKQVIDSWIPTHPKHKSYYHIRNHNDYSSYRMTYIASPPALRNYPIDEQDLFGRDMRGITERMAMHDSYENTAQWVQNNVQMLRVLNEEINACRIQSYFSQTHGYTFDRFLAEMMIESVEADDDPAMLLRDTDALKARYARLFDEEMYKVVRQRSSLTGKGPFGAFRIVGPYSF